MITPNEIRQHSFGKALRGYDQDDVKAFLASLAVEWEGIIEENNRLKIDLDKTKSSLQSFKDMETILHKTLLQAEQSSKATLEHAQREAELIIQEAEQKCNQLLQNTLIDIEFKKQESETRANQIISKAYEDRSRIESEVNDLLHRRNDILSQLSLFLSSQLERIRVFENSEQIRLSPLQNAFVPVSAPHPPDPELNPIELASPKEEIKIIENVQPLVKDNPLNSTVTPFSNDTYRQINKPADFSKSISIKEEEKKSFFDSVLANPEKTTLIHAIADEL